MAITHSHHVHRDAKENTTHVDSYGTHFGLDAHNSATKSNKEWPTNEIVVSVILEHEHDDVDEVVHPATLGAELKVQRSEKEEKELKAKEDEAADGSNIIPAEAGKPGRTATGHPTVSPSAEEVAMMDDKTRAELEGTTPPKGTKQ